MSAKLMKSQVVRRPSVIRPSVSVAIISEPNARISLVVVSPGHTLGLFLFFFFFFLALLDYVTRAHEIEICPSSVSQLSLNLMHGHTLTLFWNF